MLYEISNGIMATKTDEAEVSTFGSYTGSGMQLNLSNFALFHSLCFDFTLNLPFFIFIIITLFKCQGNSNTKLLNKDTKLKIIINNSIVSINI